MSEETRRQERTPVVQMVVVGVIASAIGIAVGLAIEWFPQQGSTQAKTIDNLWDLLIIVSVPVFVLVTVVVLFSVWKFHVRPGEELLDGPPIHGNTRLEVIWTAIPAVVLVALCSWAYIELRKIEEAQANEMRIDVVAQQFAWSYEYPQAGGKPVRSTVLYLPIDQPVRFNVKARDVLHDFWVPAFRMKVDAVPGISTRYRITPRQLGTYPVVCAELCGLGHSVMRSRAQVVSREAFDAWMEKQKAPAGAAAGDAEGAKPEAGAKGEEAAIDATKLYAEGNGTATACGACHTLADAGTSSQTGPDLDKVLKGKDAAFIRESILKPSAEIAEGFQDIMPKDYETTLSPKELDALVAYLEKVAGK
ncbi:MAG: cytochrome c oxidase subunit II [Solirubrobacterales bacterium]|nr:cytochrome c oxidase subunit II [Solirubrobacterales bacterium]